MLHRRSIVALMPLARAPLQYLTALPVETELPSSSTDEPLPKRMCSRDLSEIVDPAEEAIKTLCRALPDTADKIDNWILDKNDVCSKIEKHRAKVRGSPDEPLLLQNFATQLRILRFAETLVKMHRQGKSAAYFAPLLRELVGHKLSFDDVLQKFESGVEQLSKSLIIGVNESSVIRYNFLNLVQSPLFALLQELECSRDI